MKSKFDPLIKGLKQKLNTCEMAIAQINQEIMQKEEEIRKLLSLISEIEIPLSGNSLLFRELYEGKKAYAEMIDTHRAGISDLKKQRQNKQEEYKQQSLELEKIQYLFRKEMEAKIKSLKLKEQKELDDIATMQFKKRLEEMR